VESDRGGANRDVQRGGRGARRGGSRHRREAEIEFNRIVSFSDGVFSIAITLLVLGMFIPPHVPDISNALRHQTPDFIAYGISFAVIGRFWLVHHNFFADLDRFDETLMRLNLLYLAFIGLVPFSSQVLGDYSSTTSASVLYALNMIAVTLAFAAENHYAHRHGLIAGEERSLDTRLAVRTSLAFAGVFAGSIPVAFLSPTAATIMWLAAFVVGRRFSRRIAVAPS
jgi:uncharacterized membrane protein